MAADIILLTKTDPFSRQAARLADVLFGARLATFAAAVGEPLPEAVRGARPQVLLSFVSPWIVQADLLGRSGVALNFHPGTVDYPGAGCWNFALYDGAAEFGALCHHMLPKVDSGAVVEERRFPILPGDTVETLRFRTLVCMLSLFHDIGSALAAGRPLPASDRTWSRRPYTLKEMNALKTVEPDMSAEEVARRIRATTYPGYPGASVVIAGHEFLYPAPDRPPIS